MATRKTMDTRFWEKVDASGECWEWTGSRDGAGYGKIATPGRYGSPMLAHRYSFLLHYGPIHRSLFVCHRCDNPGCVRPSHLFAGDAQLNSQDMTDKGRHGRWNAHKQTCAEGHPFDEDNTYHRPSGGRACRACRAAADKRSKDRKRATGTTPNDSRATVARVAPTNAKEL